MGIKHKIRLGFITIGILLFLSGIISSLELARFNRTTHNLLTRSQRSIEMSKQMLDAVQEQNTALLLFITDSSRSAVYDSLIVKGDRDFGQAFRSVQNALRDPAQLETIRTASQYYNSIVSQVSDSTDITWFTDVYKTSYYNLTHAIKEFMVQIQQRTIDYTAQLERNAYRASMVGIIALGAGILLLMVFYFMLNNYFIGPVLQITRSLQGYIDSRLPFEVTITTRDEINTLKEHIAALVSAHKKTRQ
ncbi:hypothetical protein [uncultured Rikenella sp.]|uniref:hypothetical protein n=1 Tax=uncultured Rikenella sp. TaxID=368003 RepID=UPI002630F98F|nr:hypothetical protein [uncultured Rikenella sp.]